jgi:hypothetical protein
MIDLRIVVLASLLASTSNAQDPPPAGSPKATPPQASATKTADEWIRDLGSDNYRTRIAAERALRDLGKEVAPALQKAAAEAEDPEVQWRARRVLRQIEGGSQGLVERTRAEREDARSGAPEAGGRAGGRLRRQRLEAGEPMREGFDSMFEKLERQFGIDVPRARFFQDDFFRDLQEQMKGLGSGAAQQSQGMTMQIGPDGRVRVEVKEQNDKGETDTKVYEAPDLETFQREHPGVLHRNRLGLGLQPFDGSGLFQGFFTPMQGELELDALPRFFNIPPTRIDPQPGGGSGSGQRIDIEPPAPPPAGRRLGVVVRPEIPGELRNYLELADGVGLMVESVQEGSLAQALGLAKGDIVTEIAGRSIGSTDDVQQAIGAIGKGAEVEVKFVRRGQVATAKATKAEDAAPAPKLEARGKGDGTIR